MRLRAAPSERISIGYLLSRTRSLSDLGGGDITVGLRRASLPGARRRAVAAQDLVSVRAERHGGPVRIADHGPAHLVDHDVVVKEAVQLTILHAALAAAGLVGHMVHLTRCGGLVAATGPLTVLVPELDRGPDGSGDIPAD